MVAPGRGALEACGGSTAVRVTSPFDPKWHQHAGKALDDFAHLWGIVRRSCWVLREPDWWLRRRVAKAVGAYRFRPH